MPKGKPWTKEQEAMLKQMVEQGAAMETVAAKLGKSKQAIYLKARRLGLKEEVSKPAKFTSSSEIPLPAELPSVEEALKILAGALETAKQPDLTRTEVQRLNAIVNIVRTYKELLADYIDYRGIEHKLVELEAKYAKLAQKAKGNASR